MSRLIYYRIAGYVFALGLHGMNSLVIQNTLLPPKNKNLREIASLTWQFFTIWNVLLYALFGLTCDILTLANLSEKISTLISLREKIFSCVIWPCGFVVASVFWPAFLYNRSLIYPAFIDEGVPPRSNYVMHGWILVVVLWELVHLPRYEKISNNNGIAVVSIIFASYIVWVLYSHSVNGLWPYPFMKMTYGTIYFPIIIFVLYFITIVSYIHQWPLVHLIWGKPVSKID